MKYVREMLPNTEYTYFKKAVILHIFSFLLLGPFFKNEYTEVSKDRFTVLSTQNSLLLYYHL